MKIELWSSYRNINIENIEPPNHIEPKSLKFHEEPALVYGWAVCIQIDIECQACDSYDFYRTLRFFNEAGYA